MDSKLLHVGTDLEQTERGNLPLVAFRGLDVCVKSATEEARLFELEVDLEEPGRAMIYHVRRRDSLGPRKLLHCPGFSVFEGQIFDIYRT
jgi:hypothetical protein